MDEFNINKNKDIKYLKSTNNNSKFTSDAKNSNTNYPIFSGPINGSIELFVENLTSPEYFENKFIKLFDINNDNKFEDKLEINTPLQDNIQAGNVDEKRILKNFLKNLSTDSYMPSVKVFKKAVEEVSKLNSKDYKELQTFIVRQNGEIPDWLKSKIGLIKGDPKAKDRYKFSGKNEKLEINVPYGHFEKNFESLQAFTNSTNDKLDELLKNPENRLLEEKYENGKPKRKFILDKNGSPLYGVNYFNNGEISGTETYYPNDICEETSRSDFRTTDANLIVTQYNHAKTKTFNRMVFADGHLSSYYEFDRFKDYGTTDSEGNYNEEWLYYCSYNDKGEIDYYNRKIIHEDGSYNIQLGTPNSKEITEYDKDGNWLFQMGYTDEILTQIIERTEDGYVETRFDKNTNEIDYILIHHQGKSANEPATSVYYDKNGNKLSEEDLIKKFGPPEFLDYDELPELIEVSPIDENVNIFNIKNNIDNLVKVFDITDNKLRNEAFDAILKMINSPDAARVLAGRKYSELGKRTENGIKLLKIQLEKLKKSTDLITITDKAWLIKMIKDEEYFARNCFMDIPNGKIDKPHYQSTTGNCWFIESVNSLLRTPNGKKMINNCLKVDKKTGNVTVKLDGGRREYVITLREITDSVTLSNGDNDMRAFEIAMEKYITEKDFKNTKNLNYSYGGNSFIALEAITGKTFSYIEKDKTSDKFTITINDKKIEINDENIEKLKNKPIGFHKSDITINLLNKLKKYQPNIVFLCGIQRTATGGGHQYSFEIKDNETVDVHEPWNSTGVKTFKLKDFINYIEDLEIMFL